MEILCPLKLRVLYLKVKAEKIGIENIAHLVQNSRLEKIYISSMRLVDIELILALL